MTIHGNTAHEDTLQGDTLSPFLFTIFMEPLLRWLAVGSGGYRPSYQPHKSTTTVLTYDDHGYADDVSITAESIQNLKIQLKKLHLFSQYTGLQLETTKCEAIGALWVFGNLLTHTNQAALQEHINTIPFLDGSRIQYLHPNKSYKMLGLHINPVPDFREHLAHITKDVRKLAKTPAKIKLSPSLKTLVIEQLLKFK
jgi:hypothetical protein